MRFQPSRPAICRFLAGLQGQLQNQQDSLTTAKQQRVYFQTLIEQYKNLHASGRSRGWRANGSDSNRSGTVRGLGPN